MSDIEQLSLMGHPVVETSAGNKLCPYCGQEVNKETDTSINFDYWKGLVYNHNTRTWLSPQEADLFKIFLETWPNLATRTFLESKLYGAGYHYQEKQSTRPPIIHVLKRLREKIHPFGLYIHNTVGRGWWLSREQYKNNPRPTQPTAGQYLPAGGRDPYPKP